MAAAHNHYMVK